MVVIQNGPAGDVVMLELDVMLFQQYRIPSALPTCQGFTVHVAGCEPVVGFTVDVTGESPL